MTARRTLQDRLRERVDGRDVLGVAGLLLLALGGERLLPGAGMAAAGAVMVAVAVMVR
jgi:hypothetical protein